MAGWKLAVSAGFVCAVAAAFLFGYRAGRHARRMRMAQEPIRPWMTVPFVAHVRHVPREALYAAIGVPPVTGRDRRPLREIAREQHKPVQELIGQLEKVAAVAHAPGRPPQGQPPREKGP